MTRAAPGHMEMGQAPRKGLPYSAASLIREHWVRILGTAFLLFVFFGNQGFRSLVRNWFELRRLKKDIVSLRREESALGEQLGGVRSGGQIERAARRELGFIKKGEIEYRFPPPGEKPR